MGARQYIWSESGTPKLLKDQYGINVQVYNPIDVSSFQPSDKTKLLWLEAAGSVTLEFPDLKALVKSKSAWRFNRTR